MEGGGLFAAWAPGIEFLDAGLDRRRLRGRRVEGWVREADGGRMLLLDGMCTFTIRGKEALDFITQ